MCLGCVPLYTLVDSFGKSSHSTVFIENVRAMKYAQFCYLPGHSLMQDDREAFARLDRLTWFPPELLQVTGVKLNKVGIGYLQAFYDWLTRDAPLPEAIADARNMFLELLDIARAGVAKSG